MKTEEGNDQPGSEAAAGRPDKEKPDHPFKVEVVYNGVGKDFTVKTDESTKSLLDKAIQKFGPIANSHLLSLFTAGGVEFEDAKTLGDYGIAAGDELLLRPSQVRGGW